MCDYSWKDPPEYCGDYPGQKGGQYVMDEPVANRNGKTDVEGCCWWGRGVIQTTGVCNFGKMNYFLGKKAADDGRDARYPTIDFCKDPGAICANQEYQELKWIAGLFYWVQSLQVYNDGWSYMNNLKAFVSGGMKDMSFIDAVSGVVNRGCHNPPCGTGALDGAYERKENFIKVLEVLFDESGEPRKIMPTSTPTRFPTTRSPTPLPTKSPTKAPTPSPLDSFNINSFTKKTNRVTYAFALGLIFHWYIHQKANRVTYALALGLIFHRYVHTGTNAGADAGADRGADARTHKTTHQ